MVSLRFYALRYCDRLISVLYGFLGHNRFHYYLSGFDPEFARRSPGQSVLAYAMESVIAERARTFDFLRNLEDYKRRWGAVPAQNHRLVIRKADS